MKASGGELGLHTVEDVVGYWGDRSIVDGGEDPCGV